MMILFMVFLIVVGFIVGLLVGKNSEEKVAEEPEVLELRSEDLIYTFQQMFSDPQKDYDNKLERSRQRMKVVWEDKEVDENILMEGFKEQILSALSKEKPCEYPSLNNENNQLKDRGPTEISEEEKEICEKRKNQTVIMTANGEAVTAGTISRIPAEVLSDCN